MDPIITRACSELWTALVTFGQGIPLGVIAVLPSLLVILVAAWLHRRDRRRWQREEMVRRQRWQHENMVQRQLWALEDQIRLESLPDWQREAMLESRQQQAAITQEARRRLGLPEQRDEG